MTGTETKSLIVKNKRAHFDYFIEEEYDAGLVLFGWEVKSLRAGRINLSDAHVIIKRGEAFLLGADIQPLPTAARHLEPEPSRTRKLLLHRKEIAKLTGSVERQGYTLIPLKLYWHRNHVKLKLALAKGKKTHDRRDTVRDREWQLSRARLMKRPR